MQSLGDGDFTIDVGSILKGDDSVEAALTCSNPTDIFTGAVGKYLAIKITALQPTDYELVLLSSWPETGGAAVTFTGTVAGADFEMTARHYPLWKFATESSDPDAVPLTTNLVGIRLAAKAHLVIQDSLYRTPAGEVIPLPRFGISHRSI
jgi:hypothetical protein